MKTLTQFYLVTAKTVITILFVSIFNFTSLAHASVQNEVTSGTLITKNTLGDSVEVPLVKTNYDVNVTGSIVRTTLTQVFRNDSDDWLEALYLFPLPSSAAVDRLKMYIGDRIIEGKVQEKKQALATYKKAKAQGKKAALVEQKRPNMFNTSVANIPPKSEIKIEIEFQQQVEWRDGQFSFRLPMAITPRYTSKSPTQNLTIETQSTFSDGWYALPSERPQALSSQSDIKEKPTTTLTIVLSPGYKARDIDSISHPISKLNRPGDVVEIQLDEKRIIPNKDFILTWKPLEGKTPSASFFSESSDTGSYGLLNIIPPKIEHIKKVQREVIFVVDTSGSMGGTSMQAARKALLSGIEGLSTNDRFNIIDFDNDITSLFSDSEPVTRSSRYMARRFISALKADGGTEMRPALSKALIGDAYPNHLKQVVFITDGAVSNERDLFNFIYDNLDSESLFMVGIGSAPNSYFMKEAAIAGKGTFTYIKDEIEAEQKMTALFRKIEKPALTNITVIGNGISHIMPKKIPDLYAGEPLSLAMKINQPEGSLIIEGMLADTLWTSKVAIKPTGQKSGVAIHWAREMIKSWERATFHGFSEQVIKKEITDIALKFHLVSPHTSLVAVDVTPTRLDGAPLLTKPVSPNKPDGLKLNFAKTATGYVSALLFGLALMLISLITLRIGGKEDNSLRR